MEKGVPLPWSVKNTKELIADKGGYAAFLNRMNLNLYGTMGWQHGDTASGKRASIAQFRWAITQKPLKANLIESNQIELDNHIESN